MGSSILVDEFTKGFKIGLDQETRPVEGSFHQERVGQFLTVQGACFYKESFPLQVVPVVGKKFNYLSPAHELITVQYDKYLKEKVSEDGTSLAHRRIDLLASVQSIRVVHRIGSVQVVALDRLNDARMILLQAHRVHPFYRALVWR